MEEQNAHLAHIVVEDENPVALYRRWRETAKEKLSHIDLNAMNLATVSSDGKVSNRIVLLQDVEDDGFIFNTSRNGRKTKDIKEHPQVSAVFFWNIPDERRHVYKQIRIEGNAVQLDDSYAQKQFEKSPRHAQIRSVLCCQGREVQWEDLKERFDKIISDDRPLLNGDSLVAYKVVPDRMEFFLGASDAIADRVVFEKVEEGGWRFRHVEA